MEGTPKVSVVITSFNRLDLLQRTIDTFNQCNTYPIERFIVIEDSGSLQMKEAAEAFLSSRQDPLVEEYMFLFNERTKGQVQSIDIAYSRVETPYVFHSEDDYEYFKHGFIERSLAVMEKDPKIMQVWIRKTTDVMGQPIRPELHSAVSIDGNVPVNYYIMGEHQEWYGFAFQCGLRKMECWHKAGPYNDLSPETDFPSQRECKIGIALWKLGYKAAILPEGYARHTGMDRSVSGNRLH